MVILCLILGLSLHLADVVILGSGLGFGDRFAEVLVFCPHPCLDDIFAHILLDGVTLGVIPGTMSMSIMVKNRHVFFNYNQKPLGNSLSLGTGLSHCVADRLSDSFTDLLWLMLALLGVGGLMDCLAFWVSGRGLIGVSLGRSPLVAGMVP